jgi:hypothetical protein
MDTPCILNYVIKQQMTRWIIPIPWIVLISSLNNKLITTSWLQQQAKSRSVTLTVFQPITTLTCWSPWRRSRRRDGWLAQQRRPWFMLVSDAASRRRDARSHLIVVVHTIRHQASVLPGNATQRHSHASLDVACCDTNIRTPRGFPQSQRTV